MCVYSHFIALTRIKTNEGPPPTACSADGTFQLAVPPPRRGPISKLCSAPLRQHLSVPCAAPPRRVEGGLWAEGGGGESAICYRLVSTRQTILPQTGHVTSGESTTWAMDYGQWACMRDRQKWGRTPRHDIRDLPSFMKNIVVQSYKVTIQQQAALFLPQSDTCRHERFAPFRW